MYVKSVMKVTASSAAGRCLIERCRYLLALRCTAAQIPKGTFIKLQPHHSDFADVAAKLGPEVLGRKPADVSCSRFLVVALEVNPLMLRVLVCGCCFGNKPADVSCSRFLVVALEVNPLMLRVLVFGCCFGSKPADVSCSRVLVFSCS